MLAMNADASIIPQWYTDHDYHPYSMARTERENHFLRAAAGLGSYQPVAIIFRSIPVVVTARVYGFRYPQHTGRKSNIAMVTSSNGNIFRVTGHLCGEFTGRRWIPHTKTSDAELWCFFICVWINDREADDLRRYRAHYGVTVMQSYCFHVESFFSCLGKYVKVLYHNWPVLDVLDGSIFVNGESIKFICIPTLRYINLSGDTFVESLKHIYTQCIPDNHLVRMPYIHVWVEVLLKSPHECLPDKRS